jgi:superfamily II DNA or RNA helicase
MSKDIEDMLSNPKSRPVTEFLATLVATGVLDIRIAYRPGSTGIFHDKVGIFADERGNRVSFVGSANDTFSAWDIHSNHESFDVFQSWRGDDQAARVARHANGFEALWEGRVPGLSVTDFPTAARDQLLLARVPAGIDDAAEKVRHAVREQTSGHKVDQESPATTPTVSNRRTLQAHQEQVLANWRASGKRGIVAHVTGSGKTITALSAIREWVASGNPALVLVPSDLLAKQWSDEIAKEIGDLSPMLVVAGAGHSQREWSNILPDLTRAMPSLGVRITIATMQTASRPLFLSAVQGGPHLLVVADEVHRIGSTAFSQALTISSGARLGLSATPVRFGDPAGTARIFAYFGDELLPKFGIPEAIAAGRLVPYDYYVHNVQLTGSEQEDWNELTDVIKREYARAPKASDGTRTQTERLKLLLYRRAAIVKQAAGKIAIAAEVVGSQFLSGDRWLVYCDSQDQLREVVRTLRELDLPAFEYHTAMESDRTSTLQHFMTHGGIVVAIRCLDEGIDIPSVNKALVLASSTNSRQFIQRRGRVLRKSPDKLSA